MDTPYAMVHLAQVPSTQDEARVRLGEGQGPVLVVADRQTAGRGRSGAVWVDAPRAVAASLGVGVDWDAADLGLVPLIAGLAARRAIAAATGFEPELKWPNDLVAPSGTKVGGILVEASGSSVAIGLGVNLWWPEPPPGRSGIFDHDPGPDRALEIAAAWAADMVFALEQDSGSWDRTAYLAACSTIGDTIVWDSGGPGLAVDVDPVGGLVVDADGGRTILRSGSIRTVRTATLAADLDEEGTATP